jgi:hypothetical protein
MSAFAKSWETLKALPQSEIREALTYSDEFEKNPKFKTANPVIERLIRERDEANYRGRVDPEGRSLAESPGNYGLEGELPEWANPHVQQRKYGPDKGQPYTPMLRHSAERLRRLQSPYGKPAGYANFGPTGTMDIGANNMTIDESKAANAAQGTVPGDEFIGDYVVSPDNEVTRNRMSRHGNFPYGSRAGGHHGPMNVEPGSPMAQMYNMAPQLERLPEGLQPEWMEEFREAPMAKAWSTLKARPNYQVRQRVPLVGAQRVDENFAEVGDAAPSRRGAEQEAMMRDMGADKDPMDSFDEEESVDEFHEANNNRNRQALEQMLMDPPKSRDLGGFLDSNRARELGIAYPPEDMNKALMAKAWDLLKNSPSPFGASPSSDYGISMGGGIDMSGGGAASGYSPYTMDTGASARDSVLPEDAPEDPHPIGEKSHTEKYQQSNSQKPWYNLEDEMRFVMGDF